MLNKVIIIFIILFVTFFVAYVNPTSAVNVKDFGAKGDGVTDDSVAIQTAINNLPDSGGTIYLPAGTYMLGTSNGGSCCYPDMSLIQNSLMMNKSNVIFFGDGIGQSILELKPHAKMRVMYISSNNVTIEKITVDGNKAQRNGAVSWPNGDVVDALIYPGTGSSKITVRFCEVRNTIEDAIGAWMSQDVSIHDCYLHDLGTPQAGGAGISLNGGARPSAYNNIISNGFSVAIASGFGSSNALIENNTLTNNSAGGITIGGYSPDFGLSPDNSGYNISGNYIEGNGISGFAALTIASAKNGYIANNVVINNFYDGIQFGANDTVADTNWTITNNICSNTNANRLQDRGIAIGGPSNNIILRGNDCENNGNSINNQIYLKNESSVNSDWRSVNTISYSPLTTTTTSSSTSTTTTTTTIPSITTTTTNSMTTSQTTSTTSVSTKTTSTTSITSSTITQPNFNLPAINPIIIIAVGISAIIILIVFVWMYGRKNKTTVSEITNN